MNPATGTGSVSVPIAVSPGRSGCTPQLSLDYDSSAGNGPFGFGWALSLPSITRKTDQGLPRYADSDVFILSGSEDLVPLLSEDGTRYQDNDRCAGYVVHRYRPRVEGNFARIERWTHQETGEIHWLSITRDNVTTLYGKDSNSRICDPAPGTAPRIFSWLICEIYDDKGNAIVYEYLPENGDNVDQSLANERNRTRTAYRYLKRIRYGNRVSHLIQPDLSRMTWMFEVVFDYGEGHYEDLGRDPDRPAGEQHHFVRAGETAGRAWAARVDPFSSYRAGFEVRTHRRCQRVLTFHHFPELGDTPCLVRTTAFDYADLDYALPVTVDAELAHQGSTRLGSFLRSVTQSGYVQDQDQPVVVRDGVRYATYLKKSLPPLELEYSRPVIQDTVHEMDYASLENLPVGLDGSRYQWVDLNGEGISGILTEQAGSWFYKPNLGQGHFGALQLITAAPSGADLGSRHQQLIDLGGRGQLNLVSFAGPAPGFFGRTQDGGWGTYRTFRELPNIAWDDPNTRFVDLTGDSHADVLITDQDVFTWYPSLAEEGFGAAQRTYPAVDEEVGPRLVFADGTETIYLADMSGDGLSDFVRIRNGEVCYWPNLGYGRFGAKVTMDDAPWFDEPDRFSPHRILLADIDGSGTSDLIYLASPAPYLFFNQSGNGWSGARRLPRFPPVDDLATAMTTDLLGNGTTCLVWSARSASDARRPLRYMDLMGAGKPHLLIKLINNLGAETRLQYASSTKFYLADKAAGKPWITRIPFPVQVIERTETFDYISGNRFAAQYRYHHGYFDGIEREFRGFGMVEQWDTERFTGLAAGGKAATGTNLADATRVPPMLTRTWFHTGAFIVGRRISRLFEDEYYHEPGIDDTGREAMLLPDTEIPPGLSFDEAREGCRSLSGTTLRQEVYALDGSAAQDRPHAVAEKNQTIRLLQPRGTNLHAVFFTHPREAIDFAYERVLFDVHGIQRADPRVNHTITLEVDDFGNVLRTASIGYGRRYPDPDPLLTADDHARQTQVLVTVTETDYTNAVTATRTWRAPLPAEVRSYELVHLRPAASRRDITNLFGFAEISRQWAEASDGRHDLAYRDVSAAGATQDQPYRRLIEHRRICYRADDLEELLPLGRLEGLALPGEGYRLAFPPDLLDTVFRRAQGHQPPADLLPQPSPILEGQGADEGGYVAMDGGWWIPSGRVFFSPGARPASTARTACAELRAARRHFFLPRVIVDAFGHRTQADYDPHDLLPARTEDAVGNVMASANDYRVLQPHLITDANGNRRACAFDALGLVTATAVMGKTGEKRGDLLTGFDTDPTMAAVQVFAADPAGAALPLLGQATTRLVYDLGRYQRTGQPGFVATLQRETHLHDPGSARPRIQIGFSYSDGFTREIQKKTQAEPGRAPQRQPEVRLPGGDITPGGLVRDAHGNLRPAATRHRWAGTGRTVFNNKGLSVLRYEPFFSATHLYEPEREMTDTGVSPVLFYDPVERVVARLHPDHTYEKVVFGPWRQTAFDAVDTVALNGRETGDPRTDPDIAGYVRGYFAAQPPHWQTWFAQRADGQLGPAERDAARQAAAHAGTPAISFFDALGRPFALATDNGPDPDQSGPHRFLVTRVALDVEGNDHESRDATGRVVVRYDFDMLGSRIRRASMDAGERWTLNDALGNPIRSWDSRGFQRRMAYDAQRRPTGLFVTENGVERLAERMVYGEQQGRAANHRTRVYQAFDGAGLLTSVAYDFKGNLLETRRELLIDYRQAVDWSADPGTDGESFITQTSYDALNRRTTVTTPDGSVYRPAYNEAGLLEKAGLSLLGAHTVIPFVTNIEYCARGLRDRIDYGNGAATIYQRDPLSIRVVRLESTRAVPARATTRQLFRNSRVVQDLHYTYDPVGNITRMADAALRTVCHGNERVEPVMSFTYDAIYQLVEATGREHIAQTAFDFSPPGGQARDFPFSGLRAGFSDLQALRRYTERYDYDAVGNIQALRHIARDGSWTRHYQYREPSLLQIGEWNGRLTRTVVGNGLAHTEPCHYDAHGNMTSGRYLPSLAWDFEDHLHQAELGGCTAFYVYNTVGERVRKVTEAADGTRRSERLYLGDFELYREYDGAGSAVRLERQSVHVMDDQQRIAIVETQTVARGEPVQAPAPRQRFQLANHLQSACAELDADGALISYEEYHPFGTTAFQAGRSATEVKRKRYRHLGKERDEETGLSYGGARYYAPWLARWISADPAGTRSGLNLYTFADANPISKIDKSGMDSDWCVFCNPFSDDVEFAPVEFVKQEVAPRAAGALKAGAGMAGMVAGAALCETGLGCVLGGPLLVASADYGGSGLSQVWHGSPQPTVVGQLAGPKAQEIEGSVVEAAGLAHLLVEVAGQAIIRRSLEKEAGSMESSVPRSQQAGEPAQTPGPKAPETETAKPGPRSEETPSEQPITTAPTPADIVSGMERHVATQNARVANAIRRGVRQFFADLGLSQKQINILMNPARRTFAPQYGNAMERAVGEAFRSDPMLSGMISDTRNASGVVFPIAPNGRSLRPDWGFTSGPLQGNIADLTTTGGRVAKGAKYHDRVIVLEYDRPAF